MSIGIWQKQGVVIPKVGDLPAQPNVLYEAGAHILSPNVDGKVFKMWFDNDNGASDPTNGICYAESNDGLSWTRYSSNPVIPTSQQTFSKMTKVGGTYYYNVGPLPGPIAVYTSTDGISWTLRNANALVLGPGAAWDDNSICLLAVATIDDAGTWWAYYAGAKNRNVTGWGAGLATSPDGINWTKSVSNPIIPPTPTGGIAPSFHFEKINGVYYGWTQIILPTIPLQTDAEVPSDITRFSALNPGGPWTRLNSTTLYRSVPGVDGVNSYQDYSVGPATGQVADPSMVSVNGSIYLYFTTSNFNSPGGIACAIAPSTTFAQLVQTYEGIKDVPIPENLGLNLNQLASDSFAGTDANPIGGSWTTFQTNSVFAAAQRVSNKAEGTATGKNSTAWWNGLTWNADQWAQVTIGACSANSYVGVVLRQDTATSQTCYQFLWHGSTGSSGAWFIYKVTGGATFSQLATGPTVPVNVGDVLTASAIGTTLSFYLNGNLLTTVVDSSISVGAAGFNIQPTVVIGNATLSAWSGGNIVSSPSVLFGISGSLGADGAGATVSWSGPSSGSVIADGSGNYNTGEVLANGVAYIITPIKSGAVFSPLNSSQTVFNADISGINFTATSGSTAYSVPDCRVTPFGPNASRTVQGTKIYDVQVSDNSAVPGVDSRAAGAPVDCRVSPNIPQNSRTPGTYGPGE